jgi:lipopolysaccharide transport system permease protein/teichoic acid transport system permease protein
LWLPFITLVQLLFLAALAGIFAYACVFIRDIDNLVGHILRLWFFGSPVIWHEEMVPHNLQWLLMVNPMTYFLSGYRKILMYGSSPDYLPLLGIGVGSIVTIGLVLVYYSQREHELVKVL